MVSSIKQQQQQRRNYKNEKDTNLVSRGKAGRIETGGQQRGAKPDIRPPQVASSSREAEVVSRKAFERQHRGSREAAESWPDIRPLEVFSRLCLLYTSPSPRD